MQPVFSFKLRGAYNRIAQLTDDEKVRGVIASLAGNHAQGVAFSARHIRYMVGGHSNQVADEVLYRFRFPERPGALTAFLAAMGTNWNISLFHYRAQGGDFGRVLIGLELPKDHHDELSSFLDALGYYYIEETDNPAYKRFLQG